MKTASLFVFVFAMALGGAVARAQGLDAPIQKLRPMILETALAEGKTPKAIIAAPEQYKQIAEQLAQKIETAIGVRLPVKSDVDVLKDFGKAGHVIALGQYGNNKLLERLYFHWYVVVDGAQPGAGGMLLQSIHNPGNVGVNVIVVGGSDDAGVGKAAERLAEVIAKGGATLPRLHTVELGAGKEIVEARIKEVLDPNRTWPTIHPMEVQQSIAEAAMLYHYTGQEPLAQAFKQRLIAWLDDPEHQFAASDDFWRVMISWDLMEEAPVFDDSERLAIANKLLTILRRESRPYPDGSRVPNYNQAGFEQVKDLDRIRSNHHARYANSIFFGGRYFNDYYRLPEAKAWIEDARKFWRPQMKSHVALEGSVTHIALITLTEAATYAFADDVKAFMSPEVLGRIADRGMLLLQQGRSLPDSETPYIFWCAAAHLFDRPYYLRPVYAADPQMRQLRLPWRNRWALGRSFWNGKLPSEAHRPPAWAQAMPFTPGYVAQCNAYGPKNVSPKESFEFVAFSPPDSPRREYLLLEGHSTGTYSREGANGIHEFWSGGQRWLLGTGRVASVQKQTSVTVVRDGKHEALPAFASLEKVETTDKWACSRSTLKGHNGTNWHRNVIMMPDKWLLVIDQIVATRKGNYLLESRWVTPAHVAFDGDDVALIAPGKQKTRDIMRLSGTGWSSQYWQPWLYMDYINQPLPVPKRTLADVDSAAAPKHLSILARRWSGDLEVNGSHVFANLLSPSSEAKPSCQVIQETDSTFVVTGDANAWKVHIGDSGDIQISEQPPRTVAKEAARRAEPALPAIKPLWSGAPEVRVRSSAALSGAGDAKWAIGTSEGKIKILDENGGSRTTIDMPAQILALLAMDLDGDSADEIVAGSDVGGVRAFKIDGSPLWQYQPPEWRPNQSWRQSMGVQRPVITDLVPLRDKSESKILAFGLYFYVLDRNGNLISTYDDSRELDFTDLVAVKAQGMWRTSENTLRLAAGDSDGDGVDEFFGDINDPGYVKARAWNLNGQRIAGLARPDDRFLGSTIRSVIAADFDGDKKDEFVVAADAYLQQLSFYKLPKGLVWSHGVGGSIDAITVADLNGDRKQDIVFGTELGQIHAYNGAGQRLLLGDAGSAVVSIAITTDPKNRIWIGTADGHLIVIDTKGNRQSDTLIGGYVDRIVPSVDGKQMLVTSVDGPTAVFEVKP